MKTVNLIIINLLMKILLAGFYGLVFAYPVLLLWNALLPELFSFKSVSFLQSWGLIILIRLLIYPSTADTLSRTLLRRVKTSPPSKKRKNWQKEFFSGMSE